MLVLGIETSCDETSVAVVRDGKEVLSNIIATQIDVHKKYGGVVPEIASRCHVEAILITLEEALKEANVTLKDIDLIAVTKGPGLIGALLVGISAATSLAYVNNIPIIGVNHMAGHIYANAIDNELNFPLISLVVSGGHTQLVLMKEHCSFELLGETLDDAVGEAYDKVGRVIGVPYPGGPIIDKLAFEGKDTYALPRAYLDKDSFNFSFSGLKSAVINLVHNMKQRGEEVCKENLACSFQESVTDVLSYKTLKACEKYNVKEVILAGGVAANKGLREKLKTTLKDYNLKLPSLKYCTDNAAMIAAYGYYLYKKQGADDPDSIDGMPYLEF